MYLIVSIPDLCIPLYFIIANMLANSEGGPCSLVWSSPYTVIDHKIRQLAVCQIDT